MKSSSIFAPAGDTHARTRSGEFTARTQSGETAARTQSGEFAARTQSGEMPARSTKAPWDRAVDKITNMMGPSKARQFIDDTMRSIHLTQVTTMDDLLQFGEALIARGGVIEAIGRSIKIQAILHGAVAR